MLRRISSSRRLFDCFARFVAANKSTTVDAGEVEYFGKIAQKWWDETGELKALHSYNDLRVPFIRDGLVSVGTMKQETAVKPLDGLNILDIGCGGGILTEALARIGANLTGLDATAELIRVAELHADRDPRVRKKVRYVLGTVEEHCIENKEKYDVVVASEVIEHVSSRDLFLKSCTDVLKPGGSLFLTTLNKTYASWLCAVIIAENVVRAVPSGTHNWDKFVTPQEIQKSLEHLNCRTRVVHGTLYNFLTNKWSWISSPDVTYALHAVKLNT